jgi:hypothetical protein
LASAQKTLEEDAETIQEIVNGTKQDQYRADFLGACFPDFCAAFTDRITQLAELSRTVVAPGKMAALMKHDEDEEAAPELAFANLEASHPELPARLRVCMLLCRAARNLCVNNPINQTAVGDAGLLPQVTSYTLLPCGPRDANSPVLALCSVHTLPQVVTLVATFLQTDYSAAQR